MADTTPLASLSLTHVHYVRIFPPFLSSALLTTVGSKRSDLVLLCLAGSRSPRAMRYVCYSDLVDPRNRNPHDVRRTDGMRGAQFCTEANTEGGETETNAWQGIRHAIVARPVRGFLLTELNIVPACSTCTQEAHSFPYTVEHASEGCTVGTSVGKCGLGLVE